MYVDILHRLRDAVRRSIKRVGVLLDSKLSLCIHVYYVCAQSFQMLRLVRALTIFLFYY
jgi:hypothetical protein